MLIKNETDCLAALQEQTRWSNVCPKATNTYFMQRNKVVFETTKRIFCQGTSRSVSKPRKKGSSNKLQTNNYAMLC